MLQKACKEIVAHGLDDTFYVVDLANVLRMYKVMTVSWFPAVGRASLGWQWVGGGSLCLMHNLLENRYTSGCVALLR